MIIVTLRLLIGVVDALAVLSIITLVGVYYSHKDDKQRTKHGYEVDDQSEFIGGEDSFL